MTSILFTIGFTKKTAEEFFRLLRDAGVQKVVDIRENRGGQLSGFAKYPDLEFFLDRILGVKYEHRPALAPSPEIRDAYRKTKDWEQYEKSFGELMLERKVVESVTPEDFEGRVALLCSEPGPEKCHRRLVAEMLAQNWSSRGHQVEVKHLIIERLLPRRKRGSKLNAGTDPL